MTLSSDGTTSNEPSRGGSVALPTAERSGDSTPRLYVSIGDCRQYVLNALTVQMGYRAGKADWIEGERLAVAVAANEWAAAHGFDRRITVGDVERIEGNAVGHIDYASKLSLYVAEFIIDPADWQVA